MNSIPNPQREILSVSDLNLRARTLLESEFRQVWVEGEISNFVRPASGHWYFTLKDERAQVRCAMFTNRNRTLRFKIHNGMHVILRGKASLYEGRGDYQLIADNLIEVGEGQLQRQFEALKHKLEAEGLFSQQYKQPLPELPRHIGVVTSPTGAAIKDILTVLARRFPAIPVSVIPCAVQGNEAAGQIVAGIERAHTMRHSELPIDVLIVGRGGGSLEDLWPFNEERVARAIFNSTIPIVSAVGHEIDFTIADFVADARAATPSAAAELLSPDQAVWLRMFKGYQQSLADAMQRRLVQASQQLNGFAKRLRHPGRQLQEQAQRLDDIEWRFKRAVSHQLALRNAHLDSLKSALGKHQPGHRIAHLRLKNDQFSQRLVTAMRHTTEHYQQRLRASSAALHALSPLQTLGRGYAIVKDQHQGIIRNASQVKTGDTIFAQLAVGQLQCSVEAIEENEDPTR